MFYSSIFAVALAFFAAIISPHCFPPNPIDDSIIAIFDKFGSNLSPQTGISQYSRGVLKRDRDTFFWSLFSDRYGSNPNTPYMWAALPLFGYGPLSPMWHLDKHDAVVILAKSPPMTDYFSFTSFALFMPRRKGGVMPFASLGDTKNNMNLKTDETGLFAHVLTGNAKTFELVKKGLISSGLDKDAINLTPVPNDLGLFEDWTHFETVLRLFRFEDQQLGLKYLKSNHPVLYIKGEHGEDAPIPPQPYRSRDNDANLDETLLVDEFSDFSSKTLSSVGMKFRRDLSSWSSTTFTPLKIMGQDCLASPDAGQMCLGDCPDAAYFAPNIQPDSDQVKALLMPGDDELHLISLVNHRHLNSSTYSSVALLTSGSGENLSKKKMNVRATEIGVTNFEFIKGEPFASWVFTRNPVHCKLLKGIAAGCTVIESGIVKRNGYFTYCERVYLNPVTGTGPDWRRILPAKIHKIRFRKAPTKVNQEELEIFRKVNIPASVPVKVYDGEEPFRFLHIIKTGGEALEGHLNKQEHPKLDFSTCRAAAMENSVTNGNTCRRGVSFLSTILCGLNCECCAADVKLPDGGFHGTLLRSPRAHVVSQFGHCHIAHYGTWGRALMDVPLFLAERVFIATEHACGDACAGGDPDWKRGLEQKLIDAETDTAKVRIVNVHNTQAHALTCSKKKGSLGHHFRVLEDGVDNLTPDLEEALKAMQRMEWIGLTDLFEESLCILHYQANGTLPSMCDCDSQEKLIGAPKLGHYVETRTKKRHVEELSDDVLRMIDEHTRIDRQLFAAALRLLLARLRWVEEQTGASILRCLDWEGLKRKTAYIEGLWEGRDSLFS